MGWDEPRLVSLKELSQEEQDEYLPIDLGFLDLLWLPDLYPYNMKSVKKHELVLPLAGETE